MDTLYLTWDSEQVRKDVIANLQRIGTSASLRDKDGRRILGRRGYESNIATTVDGHPVFAAFRPLAGYMNCPELFLTVHLSHFRTLQDAIRWLQPIFGNSFSELPNGRILRLDRCIDLSLPFDTLLKILTQDRVTHVLKFTSCRRSLYLGKPPRQTVLYEKLVKPEYLDDEPLAAPELDAQGRLRGVRLEVRTSREKLPIRSFGELEKLRAINPFEHLTFHELSEGLAAHTKNRHIISAYLRCKDEHGAQIAKLEFNDGRNFQRNIGKYLAPIKVDTAGCWEKRVGRFFGSDPICFNLSSPSASSDAEPPIDTGELEFLFGTPPPAEALEDDPEIDTVESEDELEDVEPEEPCANSSL